MAAIIGDTWVGSLRGPNVDDRRGLQPRDQGRKAFAVSEAPTRETGGVSSVWSAKSCPIGQPFTESLNSMTRRPLWDQTVQLTASSMTYAK